METVSKNEVLRELWKAVKFFRVPFTHEFIQDLTEDDIALLEWSTARDNPKFNERIENTVYDDEFDDWAKAVQEGKEVDYGVPLNDDQKPTSEVDEYPHNGKFTGKQDISSENKNTFENDDEWEGVDD
jgi:hypothetical protein